MPITLPAELINDLAKEMAKGVDSVLDDMDSFFDRTAEIDGDVIEAVLKKWKRRYPGLKEWMLWGLLDKRVMWRIQPVLSQGAVVLTNRELKEAEESYGDPMGE